MGWYTTEADYVTDKYKNAAKEIYEAGFWRCNELDLDEQIKLRERFRIAFDFEHREIDQRKIDIHKVNSKGVENDNNKTTTLVSGQRS